MARFLTWTVTGAVLLSLLPGCREARSQDARQTPSTPTSRDASPEIRRLLDDLMAADNAGDVDRAVGYYTADAILLPPSDPEVAGRDKIRAHYVGALGRFALKISATALEIRTAADWGVVRGTVQGTLAEKPDGAAKPLHDKFLGILERGADGQWRFARLMWSPVAKPG